MEKIKMKIKKEWVITNPEIVRLITGSNWNESTETRVAKTKNKEYYVFRYYPEGSSWAICTDAINKLKEEKKW